LLVELGAKFDIASINEIELCLIAGAKPEHISFGNTIKKIRDIAAAYEFGVRLFAFDSLPELEKIAIHAPGSSVYCRIFVECDGAVYPLSRKFGCDVTMEKM
jgi:ornithine decarboxylase